MAANPLDDVYRRLRHVMLDAAPGLAVVRDEPGTLLLKTHWMEARTNEAAWFGWIAIKKSFVSYHLMPLYHLPELEAFVPEALGPRRQGKTCFNFKRIDEALFAEVEGLTERAGAMEDALKAKIG